MEGAAGMKMGRERMILGWDIHAAMLKLQLEQVESELAEARKKGTSAEPANARGRVTWLTARLAELQRELGALGPSPRARMG
jgi:hypothetical protein